MKKLIIASWLIMVMAIFILVNLMLVAVNGQVIIQEPNRIMLSVKIILLFAIILFGAYQFAEAIRKRKGD